MALGGGVGAAIAKRPTNSDVNMIPFIDLLMVTIAFLLITAVWATNSRISADAQVPGPPGCGSDCSQHVAKMLHVHLGDREFQLVWKQASTVISSTSVPRTPAIVGDGASAAIRYPDLAKQVEVEWTRQGLHTDPSDKKVDQVVLHSDDRTPFKDIVAVLDAIHATQRDLKLGDGSVHKVPAFNMTFATR
jgi:biopolymer transport protein ExbD